MFQKHGVQNLPAIIVNYFVCVLTASVVLGEVAIPSDIGFKPWFYYAIFLGFIFVFVFTSFAAAVQKIGIALSTIFQKMTMMIPAVMGIFYYNEAATLFKILGICLAALAIVIIQLPLKGELNAALRKYWYLAAITFLGSGIIDGLLYFLEVEGISQNGDISFVASLFGFAGIAGLSLFVFRRLNDSTLRFGKKEIIGGIALGIPNFFSIYLLLLLLSNGWGGSVVFPINNVGILVLATLFGVILFKEKLNIYRVVGFICAIVSIGLIAWG